MELVDQSRSLCALAMRAGRAEVCPGAECPLWEKGRCTLEQLTAEGELYADDWPDEDDV